MRAVIAITLLALSSVAHAERAPVLSVGVGFAATSYANETNNDPHMNGTMRVTLAFEDTPIATPPPGMLDTSGRIVPELFAGSAIDDVRGEGFVGAGLRAELQLARNAVLPRPYTFRFGFYGAARAKIVGKNQDAGGEFVIGEYVLLKNATRFGWEGGLGLVKRPELRPEQSPQLEALMTVYVGWGI